MLKASVSITLNALPPQPLLPREGSAPFHCSPEHLEVFLKQETAEQMRIERAQKENNAITARIEAARVNQAG
jgi:hypothetical protein